MVQKRNVGTGIATRRGEVQEQDKPVITDKVTEQPLVNVGGIRGRSTIRPEPETKIPERLTSREAFKLEGPGVTPELFPETKGEKAPTTKIVDRNISGGLRRLVSPRPIEPEVVTTTTGVQRKIPGGIKRAAATPKKSFNILNFEGIENIFSSAGELAAHFASPEFQAQQRKARGVRASQRGRITELKSIDSSIKALSGALADVELSGDDALKATLTTQLSSAVKQRQEISTGGGGIRRGTDASTVEGFAAILKDLGLSNDEIKIAASRRFAEGA